MDHIPKLVRQNLNDLSRPSKSADWQERIKQLEGLQKELIEAVNIASKDAKDQLKFAREAEMGDPLIYVKEVLEQLPSLVETVVPKEVAWSKPAQYLIYQAGPSEKPVVSLAVAVRRFGGSSSGPYGWKKNFAVTAGLELDGIKHTIYQSESKMRDVICDDHDSPPQEVFDKAQSVCRNVLKRALREY